VITFIGTVVQQYVGCTEGSGQDYARLESPQGIIEYHPANGTTGQGKPINLGSSLTCAVELATIGVGAGWTSTFNNLNIQTINLGVTFDDVITISGGITVVFHLPHGTVPVTWLLGVKLNTGLKNT
jgi:hypothetical protein